MSECTHDCSSCGEACSERKTKESFLEPANSMSKIGKVIGIVSGKGGVGKSLVTSLMASGVQKRGFSTAVLDADITGPSIPKIFGIKGMAKASEYGILPSESSGGVKVMSVNLLLENITDPVVWRGPVIAGTVKQFWTDVIWKDVDLLFMLDLSDILVIYDDISLEPGMLRLRTKGSAGGHNGMKSIIKHLGGDTFPRIRVGIGGEKHPGQDLADYVLGHFKDDEKELLSDALDKAEKAAELFAQDEFSEAMNKYSVGKKKRKTLE